MQDLVGINRVDLINERLVRWDTELVRFDRNSILPKREQVNGGSVLSPKKREKDHGVSSYLDYG